MRSSPRALVGALLLAFVSLPVIAAPASSLRGSWAATIGTRPALQGTWSAVLQEDTPNAAAGTWTLVDARDRVVAQGTWSATRTEGKWRGAWSARASAGGRVRSGTWSADVTPGPGNLAELLRSTLEKQLTGAWRSAGLQGSWALRAQ